ncbi:MAG: metallophosphoesterase [Candidatus Altiarchaeales archaeon]|nr:metallophosphoesterase [Candidatus Altiarchaeales archaeon]
MTIICCISDSHLGYRHRMKKQRLLDYENSFLDATSKAMELNPSMLIFAGDLVHHPRPEPKSLHTLITKLIDIAEKTPVIVCIGNHEIEGHLGTAYTPIFSDLHKNIHVLSTDNPHITLNLDGKRVGIHGFQYLRSRKLAQEKLAEISGFEKNDYDILCLHQGIERYLSPFELSLKVLREAAGKFDLILSGHVHKHQEIKELMDVTPSYYVGSTERISFNEAENPTGFLALRNFNEVEFIPVKSAIMDSVKGNLGSMKPGDVNKTIEDIIKDNRGRTECLQIRINVELEGDYFDLRHDWSQEQGFKILDVSVIPSAEEEFKSLEKIEISKDLVEEYFEKSGMHAREDLREICKELYEKYAGGFKR